MAGTKSEDVIEVLKHIDEHLRYAVEETSVGLSDSTHKIVKSAFPKAARVIDRFHVQKLACDVVQELRIKHRWDAIRQANDKKEKEKRNDTDYQSYRYSNGDTSKELLIRPNICYSNQQMNGLTVRSKEQKYYLENILTSNRHIHCVILYG